MSAMYAREVPLYATLVEIVARVNGAVIAERGDTLPKGEIARLGAERHGAIRVGTAAELRDLARVFAVMGMAPVGYYDLAPAGIPVHSTAFRPTTIAALQRSPFRIFTSLLRLDLIEDAALRTAAQDILSQRRILSEEARALTTLNEREGGLSEGDARAFVTAAIETFRWQARAIVNRATYRRLVEAHRLVADIVAFRGPHINHLTPRTLDIDRAHSEMARCGMPAKAEIEGPPRRGVPILLRQTSFHALEEEVRFGDGAGAHTARFGEIEQRGAALTREGRALYDRLLPDAAAGSFAAFPDDAHALRRERLAFFRYAVADTGRANSPPTDASLDRLIEEGCLTAEPITYEDFLPVSAAGIFRSNLGTDRQQLYAATSSQQDFEEALGRPVIDPFALCEEEQRASLTTARQMLGLPA